MEGQGRHVHGGVCSCQSCGRARGVTSAAHRAGAIRATEFQRRIIHCTKILLEAPHMLCKPLRPSLCTRVTLTKLDKYGLQFPVQLAGVLIIDSHRLFLRRESCL
mmetsp:Transcript_61465/g.179679  ORF Transcript_61465/g.179679 Transcript_61465/m.179679 type:complete len:105 (-) Transcript_61465:654-968(-)